MKWYYSNCAFHDLFLKMRWFLLDKKMIQWISNVFPSKMLLYFTNDDDYGRGEGKDVNVTHQCMFGKHVLVPKNFKVTPTAATARP